VSWPDWADWAMVATGCLVFSMMMVLLAQGSPALLLLLAIYSLLVGFETS
jgi:hypothetical protein